MKKIFYFTALAVLGLLPAGCYEDKGNYDYTDIGDVTLDVASGIYEYNVMLGDRLTIPMKVTSEVAEAQLEYIWERNEGGSFIELGTGKDFDRNVGPDEYFPSYGEYRIRLKAVRTYGERVAEAYSPLILLTVGGESGLMVLHGNDTESDVGVIQDPDFTVRAGVDIQKKVVHNLYSTANGEKLPGKGVLAVQHHASSGTIETNKVYIVTDRGAVYAGSAGFRKEGDYADMFLSVPGAPPLYKGKPEAFGFYMTSKALIDDGDVFVLNGIYNFKFNVKTGITGLSNYKLSKYSYLDTFAYVFDMNSRRFVMVSLQGTTPTWMSTYSSPDGPFDVNDVKADLLYFDRGGAAGHFLGVFEEDDGDIFIGEVNFAATNQPGDYFAHAKYDIGKLPAFGSAKFHAFGSASSMCYYATDSGIYQYAVLGSGGTTTGRKLMMGVNELPISGEITMMKMMRSRMTGNSAYQHRDKMLIVGTYENGVGTLHAIVLDIISGSAVSHKTFTGFGRIYDANLKSL